MALITISGYPCSGKTRRTEQISAILEQYIKDPTYEGPLRKVISLSDDTLHLKRASYDDSGSEKPMRGTLFTAMQREMASDTILIVDSLNYIKGFRYQMYCAAREMKLRVCTVFVVATQDLCRLWNKTRKDELKYNVETLENLIFRYEEPSSMVRWDSPLFTVLWTDNIPPVSQIWEAITKGAVKPPNSGTLAAAKAPVDALHTLEQTTAAIVSNILAGQTGAGGRLNLNSSPTLKPYIILPSRNMTLSELQRLKRQFVTVHRKAITLGTIEKGAVDWAEDSITSKFVTYLEENLKS
ncbi:chromatin associated protein KTI12 [Collybia nuda]|uniref:Chromatin associated protein KTI12 n=1 Tax=Collybia nuda TaxID=64659 RepID=A0A9P5Y0Q3_9AGAR|nr:chromatin associated protein KTI12 [Collybia nuda]